MPEPSENTRERPAAAPKRARAADDVAALLKHYGITTVPKPTYEWGGYRYTNPDDAIAAARRGGGSE
jgi:hypothetical protein